MTFFRSLAIGGMILTALGCRVSENPSESAIRAKMTILAGDNAMECGLVALSKSPELGWECAAHRDALKEAFWFAVQAQGTDSEVWHIISRGVDGKRYVLFYTSNNHGQQEFRPFFSEHECFEPFTFELGRRFSPRCGADVP